MDRHTYLAQAKEALESQAGSAEFLPSEARELVCRAVALLSEHISAQPRCSESEGDEAAALSQFIYPH